MGGNEGLGTHQKQQAGVDQKQLSRHSHAAFNNFCLCKLGLS